MKRRAGVAAGVLILLCSIALIATLVTRPPTPTLRHTSTSANAPTATSAPPPTSAAAPDTQRPAPTATLPLPGFGDGMKLVGTDVSTGTYRSDGGSACHWQRLSGFGGTPVEILAADKAYGPLIVTIKAGDVAFDSSGCGRWTPAVESTASAPAAFFGPGTFLVNREITPGLWRANSDGACNWVRLRGFSGTEADIITTGKSYGAAITTIAASDIGFTSRGCGTWTKSD